MQAGRSAPFGGFGLTVAQRLSVVKTASPEMASLNAGSLDFALRPVLEKMKEFKHNRKRIG
jgi:hypothetical protein